MRARHRHVGPDPSLAPRRAGRPCLDAACACPGGLHRRIRVAPSNRINTEVIKLKPSSPNVMNIDLPKHQMVLLDLRKQFSPNYVWEGDSGRHRGGPCSNNRRRIAARTGHAGDPETRPARPHAVRLTGDGPRSGQAQIPLRDSRRHFGTEEIAARDRDLAPCSEKPGLRRKCFADQRAQAQL